jgi:hypothetical protein
VVFSATNEYEHERADSLILVLSLLCQGAASIDDHAGIGIGSRQRLIGMAGMLQLASMPEEHAACMTMIAKLLLTLESHSWHRT